MSDRDVLDFIIKLQMIVRNSVQNGLAGDAQTAIHASWLTTDLVVRMIADLERREKAGKNQ